MKLFISLSWALACTLSVLLAQRTEKPVLHGKHWVAITGKPLAATAGAATFHRGGNAVDAACAMLAATCTMWDVLSWGGETQALIFNPKTKKVIGINALGMAPTGATPEFFKNLGLNYPPDKGPLSAITPGTPAGLMTMLAEYGELSLKDILQPAMQMAEGYPMEADAIRRINQTAEDIEKWPYSREVFLKHPTEENPAPKQGEIFVQKDLLNTLKKLVEAEQTALRKGKSRKEAIYAAKDRFYKGDIAEEFVRGCQEQGGLISMEDLASWQLHIEEPEMTKYKDIEVYKLTSWVQGPVMLQALNMLENFDVKAYGYNTARYIHLLYQVMNLAFADRDFYYGDPYFPPEEPIRGLLSKEYAKERIKTINWNENDMETGPGDPYPFQQSQNPYLDLLQEKKKTSSLDGRGKQSLDQDFIEEFYAGTTSIQAADEDGWVVSVTPSGGWIPACIAGRTGIGMSQRLQSFVLDERENPFNVVAPGKRPRATLTPAMAIKDGKPYLSFAVQGGDSQDQNLLQFFLNMVEFGMNVQEAAEAANINSFQMHGSFGQHETRPGHILLHDSTPPWTRKALQEMGYKMEFQSHTSGPINAIFFDWKNGSFWGGASNFGDDYGIAW